MTTKGRRAKLGSKAGKALPRKKSISPGKASRVDAYLRNLAPAHRSALQHLRRAVRTAAPGAVETISYRIPAFGFEGKMLVWYAAFKNHCSFFPGVESIRKHAGALRAYQVSKGTIKFFPEKPMPRGLVSKLVKTRIAGVRVR